MSYDLHVFGRADSPAAALSTVLASLPHDSGGGGVSIRGARTDAVLTVDGPLDVERDDIPVEVLDRVLAPSVVFQLSASSTYPEADARRVARGLAEAVQGAVHDCRTGEVVWPRARSGHRRAGTVTADDGRVDALHLSWYLRPEDLPSDFEQQLLDCLRRHLPEAVPQRYGNYEPPQHRLELDGDTHFTAFAAATDGTIWTGRRPVVGGRYTRRLGRWVRGSRARPVGHLKADLLLAAVDTPAWRAELQQTLVAVASLSSSFYAQAAVGTGYRGVRLASDNRTQRPEPLATNHGWQGLPSRPVWLAWFGDMYRPLVDPHLGSRLPLVRTAEHPTGAARLPLPPEMTVRDAEQTRPGRRAERVPPQLQPLT